MNADSTALAGRLADAATFYGAPRVASLVATCGLVGAERDDVICRVIDELRRRRRDGLASQVAAFRFVEPTGSP